MYNKQRVRRSEDLRQPGGQGIFQMLDQNILSVPSILPTDVFVPQGKMDSPTCIIAGL